MKRKFEKKPIFLAAVALILMATLSVGSAMAYFTTYSTASGSKTMHMGFTTTVPEEKVDSTGKHVRIHNTGDYSCYVRVKFFSDEDLTIAGDGWTYDSEDEYWYYGDILEAGATTNVLDASYEFPVNDDDNKTESFNIIVIQECTPVVYGDDGSPQPNWDNVITSDSAN